MPDFDVPTDAGMVRVSAKNATEAARMASEGKGLLLPRLAQPGGEQAPPGLYAQPPAAPDATVYNPGTPGAPRPAGQDMLQPVFDAVVPAATQFAGRAALPTAGSLVFGVGGQFVPGLSAVPPQVREGVGSMIGTGANMLLGIEEPSLEQLLLSGVIPASVRGSGRLATKALPGAASARAAGLVDEVQQVPDVLRRGITQPPDQLYGMAHKLNTPIVLDETATTAKRLLREEQSVPKGLRFEGVRAITNDLEALARQSPQGVGLEQLDEIRQRIGAKLGGVTDPKEKGALKQLYGSVLRDIEATASQQGGDGARLLLEGIRQQRRTFAADDLQELVKDAIGQPRPVDGLQQVSFGKIMKVLENPKGHQQELLADFLNSHPAEREEIVALLTDMNRRNVKLLPPSGTMFGSGVALARGGAGYMAAKGANMLLGTNIDPGFAAATTTLGSQLVSRALLTPLGRGFLRQALADGPTINLTQLLFQLTGQGIRGTLGPAPISGAADAIGVGGSTAP